MRTERRLFASVLALSLLSAASVANAYCRTTTGAADPITSDGCVADGIPLYWRSLCVQYRLSQAASREFSLSDAQAITGQAFAQWMNPGAVCVPSISAVGLAPSPNQEVGYQSGEQNENLIVFRDDAWDDAAANVLVLTTVSFDPESGEILDADVEINTFGYDFTPGQLRTVLTHEFGHFLGLAHSSDPDSILQPSLAVLDREPPLLGRDDAEAICAVYPESGERLTLDAAGTEVSITPTACATLVPGSDSCGPAQVEHGCSLGRPLGSAGAAWAALGALALAALGTRRRARG